MTSKINLNEFSYDVVIPSALLFNKKIDHACLKLYAYIKGLTRAHGYCFATNKYLAALMDSSEDSVQRWLRQLKGEGFVEVETDKKGIHWQRRIYVGVDLKKSLRRLTDNTPPLYEKHPPPLPVTPILEDKPNEEEEDEDILSTAKPPTTPPPTSKKDLPEEAKKSSQKLFGKIKEMFPNTREPKFSLWEADMDKLHRIDKRSWKEIDEMIDWAFDDRFWVKVIQSPDSLRRHWDKMSTNRSPISNKGSRIEKNREIANEIKTHLAKNHRGHLLFLSKDFAKNSDSGESITFDIPVETFEGILIKWFDLKKV